jgi:glycosyltransferase involved in cell wall biosynthesis
VTGKSGAENRLTVAHFMPWSGIGGVEIATLRMVEATREEFRHIAFCMGDAAVKELFERIRVETVTYSPPVSSVRHAGKYYKDSLVISDQLESRGADVAHFAETKAAETSSLAALIAGVQIVCHVRNTYPNLSLRRRLPLLPVDCFVFVSEEAKRQFGISLPDGKTRVIYDAIELPDAGAVGSKSAVRSELGIPDDCTVVGMVARVNPQKDYFTLAFAARMVLRRRPNTRFLVVGDKSLVEPNRRHYEEVAGALRELGIEDNFIFTGHRDDVYRLIEAMDIFVLATHREGFGLCVAEAMALQKPVVATAVGGLLEVVEHRVTGLLHQHEDSGGLAEMILSLIDNPDEAKKFGMAGYEHVRRSYSQEAFSRDLAGIYRDLVAR